MDEKVLAQTRDNTSTLAMGQLIKLRHDIAEVIVDEGKVIDMDMVNEYHRWIEDNLSDPCMLLVNKIHPYAYTFEAQKEIACLDKIKAMAVVVYNEISKLTTNDLASFPREQSWNIQIFNHRHDALLWLESQADL